MKKLGYTLIVLSFLFLSPLVLVSWDNLFTLIFSSAVGVILLITGVYLVKLAKLQKTITRKQLRIISVIMLGIGISLVLSYFYGRFQYDAIVDHESFTISLIGATLSLSWYSPFFIGSYWLYRKSIKIGEK